MLTPLRAAIEARLSPGRTTYEPSGCPGAPGWGGPEPVVALVVGGTTPVRWSAAAASGADGIWIVLPRTTLEFSDRPLAAASARVVKLFLAAIDQRVSPGW